MCVQSLDDSLNSAIHITYRISLRSSSLREPRYPSTGVVVRVVGCGQPTGVDARSWGGAEENRATTSDARLPPERRELLHSAACPRAPNPRSTPPKRRPRGREHAEADPRAGRGPKASSHGVRNGYR